MLQTPEIIASFDSRAAEQFHPGKTGRVLITGEGSSRIFPAKNAIHYNLKRGSSTIFTAGSYLAREYDLKDSAVFGSTNSGSTKELAALIDTFGKGTGTPDSFTLVTANGDSPLLKEADSRYILGCGQEKAVAATKSVVEQALFFHSYAALGNREDMTGLSALAGSFASVLEQTVPRGIAETIARSGRLYFAGKNDGAAEELTLKTNEIVRKPSAFLEGTYLLHGIEEILGKEDVIVILDPYPEEYEKIRQCITEATGASVVAVSSRQTPFPTIQIPSLEGYDSYLHLAAGWNLLVDAGLLLGIDLDTPSRARKVGNGIAAI